MHFTPTQIDAKKNQNSALLQKHLILICQKLHCPLLYNLQH